MSSRENAYALSTGFSDDFVTVDRDTCSLNVGKVGVLEQS
jgi:hypothetical protein